MLTKGQTQAVTAVMLTGAIVGSIGVVYNWGSPLLEKRQAEGDVKEVEKDIFQLHSKIISVSNQGSGSSTTVTVDVDGRIIINETNDYIQVSSEFDKPVYSASTWSLLKGGSFQNLSFGAGYHGMKGDDLPGVVAVRASSSEDSSTVIYRVEFRNLCVEQTGELEKIDLVTGGQERAAGTTTLRLTNDGTRTDTGLNIPSGKCEGIDVNRERSVVDVEVQ